MKKQILILSLILTIIFPVSSFAAVKQISETISHIEYDQECNVFYAVTTHDGSGQWVLHVMTSENENKAILDGLNNILSGRMISIVYDDWNTSDKDYWNVLDWSVVDSE